MKIASIIIAALFCCIPTFANESNAPYGLEIVQDWLYVSDDVFEVCFFKKEWQAPTKKRPKGISTHYGRITKVHRGTLKLGDKFMMVTLVEYGRDEWSKAALKRPDKTSIVEGEIYVIITSKDQLGLTAGYYNNYDSNYRFSIKNDFYKAFTYELKRDPTLKGVEIK